MNKLTIFLLLLCLSVATFGQVNDSSSNIVKTEYLQKSKSQKLVGWILLGGGAALTSIGFAIGINSSIDELASLFDPGHDDNGFVIGSICFFTGVAAMLASIPVFIASSRNKKKGMSLSFKEEKVLQIQKSNFVYKPVPSLTLKINL